MSASIKNSAIYLTDTPNEVQQKLSKDVSSMDEDVVFQYLRFFLDDDEEYAKIERRYKNGNCSVEELAPSLIKVIQELVRQFQTSRTDITDQTLDAFMERRLLK